MLPVETFVHATLGSGFPVALHGRNTSFSASTDILAVVTVMMRGFTPPPPAPTSHGKGGAAVGRRELIRPARYQQIEKKKEIHLTYLVFQIFHLHFIPASYIPPLGHQLLCRGSEVVG